MCVCACVCVRLTGSSGLAPFDNGVRLGCYRCQWENGLSQDHHIMFTLQIRVSTYWFSFTSDIRYNHTCNLFDFAWCVCLSDSRLERCAEANRKQFIYTRKRTKENKKKTGGRLLVGNLKTEFTSTLILFVFTLMYENASLPLIKSQNNTYTSEIKCGLRWFRPYFN